MSHKVIEKTRRSQNKYYITPVDHRKCIQRSIVKVRGDHLNAR